MMQKSRTPAPRKPSMICCKTGLPRTGNIGLGRSLVRLRMRVPRPAASKTALVIMPDVSVCAFELQSVFDLFSFARCGCSFWPSIAKADFS